MNINVGEYSYENEISLIQIEMTGCCNMKCKHCRAYNEPKKFFSFKNMQLVLDFIKEVGSNNFKLTFSGGEPFMHPQLIDFITLARNNNVKQVVITTNASLVTDEMLEKLNNLNFEFLCIQVSLDSLEENKHDEFRGYKGAFHKCDELLEKIKHYPNIHSSIRMTVTKETIANIEEMIQYAIKKESKVIGIGSIIPFGKAENCKLSLNNREKFQFLSIINELHKKYINYIDVVTEDPLKCIVSDSSWRIDKKYLNNPYVFGGCTAGIESLNIRCDGIMTPCSMMSEIIMDINEIESVYDMINKYENSDVIKNLFSRNFSGKCGNCKYKYTCGGCRAVAKAYTNSYMGSDMSCWYYDAKN